MKRLSILLVAILAFSAGSYAVNGNEYNVLWTLNNRSVSQKVSDYVGATPAQTQVLNEIFYASVQRLTDALVEGDKTEAQRALIFNIANVKAVLSKQQFRKYLEILNKTYQQQNVASLTNE
ncbi:hypothetical protein [Dysgonomonas sp. 511]|uniref:hypothetical protein n=1 Tax=Dysgonomonas sp. 511 TaxID=2302930 RepID=UPI0013D7BB1D|nr:hypothetical protein [Dysgonomonas sp. 511]NDV77428.1 hypothetical protein [Dysgonomonas sp. 511]